MMQGKWERVSPRGTRLVGGSKRMNIMVMHWVFTPEWSRVLSVLCERQFDQLVRKPRASRLAL